jgi:hypothetical protein
VQGLIDARTPEGEQRPSGLARIDADGDRRRCGAARDEGSGKSAGAADR